ncbi:hypothetical protein ACHAXM_006713 [Skeletonema potamos]
MRWTSDHCITICEWSGRVEINNTLHINMPELRLRLNKSGSLYPSKGIITSPSEDGSYRPSSSNLKTPRAAVGDSAAMDDWNRKRALKLKTSPPTNSIISSSSYDSSNDHDQHHYLSPLKISSSHDSPPPRLLHVNHSPRGKISPKSVLFKFMALMSFAVGVMMNWKDPYEGHPRCATFEMMPKRNSPYVNQHFRALWSSNFQHDYLPPLNQENEEVLAEMEKSGQSVNDSNDEKYDVDSEQNKVVQKVTGNSEDCVPKASWQTISYPTCNNMHEIDFVHSVGRNTRSHIFAEQQTGRRFVTNYSSSKSLQQKQEVDLELKGQGWFRSAWSVDRDTSPIKVEYDDDEWEAVYRTDEQLVLKTLRIEREFLEEYFELHRRDAMALERLTHSPYVLDIYGYCGQSTLNEFANAGTLHTMVKYRAHKKKRLKLAYEIAKGVSDVHSIDYPDFTPPSDGSGVSLKTSNATMVHYDLNLHNIAIVDGRFPKLNDFNVAMFLSWDLKKKATCGFEGRFREPWWRSPEEMQNHVEDGADEVALTEKVDVYSLGNILWSLLINTPPWKKDNKKMDELRPRVARGEMPDLPSKIANSTDPTIVAIKNAMFKCLRVNPEERASAGEVAHDLKMALKEVKRLEKEEKERKKKAEKDAAKLAKEEELKKKEAGEAATKNFDKKGAALESRLFARRQEEKEGKDLEEAVEKAFEEEGAALAPQLTEFMLQEEQKKDEAEGMAAKAVDEDDAAIATELLARREPLISQAEQKAKEEDGEDTAAETEPLVTNV